MSGDETKRAKIRRQTWHGEIKRPGDNKFRSTSLLGPTEKLHRLAKTPEEMGRNILLVEQLRKSLYPDFDRPMRKQVLKKSTV